MLLWYFNEASFDNLPGLGRVAESVLAARGDEPDLPLEVVRAVDDSIHEVLHRTCLFIHSLVGLSSLDVNLPAEFSINVVKHLIDDIVYLFEGLASFLQESEVLEP